MSKYNSLVMGVYNINCLCLQLQYRVLYVVDAIVRVSVFRIVIVLSFLL